MSPGDFVSSDTGFITNKDLDDVSIWVTPEISQWVIARPFSFDKIQAGSLVALQIIFNIPQDLATGSYDGTIHVKVGARTIAKPLPIIINVSPTPEVSPPPAGTVELFYDDGTAEGFDYDPILGRAVFFTKFVSGGQAVKIMAAKIFVKVLTQPAGEFDVYIWDFNRELLIQPLRVAPAESGWFIVDLSQYNLTVSNEFYLGIAWPSSAAPPLLGVDMTSPQGKSYVVILPLNTFIPVSNSNFMIRAIVEKL